MSMKEHPFVVTTSIPHDKSTITYDAAKKNRSDAVGKVYRINDDGKAELPAEGEEFDGVIIAVDDSHITGAYMFGGLKVPIADGETVARGNKLVAGLGKDSAKGYVKAVTLPDDLETLDADTDVDSDTKRRTTQNAVRTQVNTVASVIKGKGSVIEVDTTHALLAFPG